MKKTLLFLFLITASIASAQKEAAIWYFGSAAGLDFNNTANPPVLLTDGQMETYEGCASIADATGNLLFYVGAPSTGSSSLTVWDKNHNIMPNGTGLLGDVSATQSTMIVPKPGDPDIYYVFTVENYSTPSAEKAYYSILDMTLNGGNGDVVAAQKNVNLQGHFSEKITAVKGDGDYFWIICYADVAGSSTYKDFYTYKLDATGITTTPVISPAVSNGGSDGRGYLKISASGTKLALANTGNNSLTLYDFDIATGQASNMLTLANPTAPQPYGLEFSLSGDRLYAIFYSGGMNAGTTNLVQYDLSGVTPSAPVVIDSYTGYRGALQMAINQKIYATLPDDYYGGSLQMGVIEDPENLGTACNYNANAITFPNIAGGNSGNMVRVYQGLPPFIQSFFNVSIVYNQDDSVCEGNAVDFSVNSNQTLTATEWDFGDGSPLVTNNETPTHNFPIVNDGTDHIYTITLHTEYIGDLGQTESQDFSEDITIYAQPEFAAGSVVSTITQCDDNNDGFYDFDLHALKDTEVLGFITATSTANFQVRYFPSEADLDANTNEITTNPYTNITAYNETLWIRVENTNHIECYTKIPFDIEVYDTPTVDPIASPAAYCTGDAATATPFTGNGVAGTTYTWVNTGDDVGFGMTGTGDIAAFTTVNGGTTILTATIEVTPSTATCTGATETFTVTVNPLPTVDAVGSQVVCNNDAVAAINFTGNAVAGVTYEWTNDNTAIGLAGTGTGDIASFTATNTTNGQLVANLTVTPVANGCSGTAQNFTITVNPTPTVDPIASPAAYCAGDAAPAIPFTGNGVAGTTYTWVNTSDDVGFGMTGTGDIAAFTTVNAGTTILTATIAVTPNAGCTGATETFTVTVNPTPTVDAVGDQTLCNGDNTDTINFTGNAVSGVSYEWTNDNTAIGLPATGTGDIATYTVINTTTTPIVANFTVTPVANGCSGTSENFTITINGTPDIVLPNNQQVCDDDNDGFWIFDLTQDEATILNGQDPALFDVLYYSDATYTTQIATPTTYQNTLAYQPDTIYPQVINTTTGCMSTANIGFTVEVFATPYVANSITNLTLCDNDNFIGTGSADFALDAFIPNLLGTQATDPNNNYNVTFHLTQPDADAGVGAIALPYNLPTGSEIPIFVRIENAGLIACADTSEQFTIHTYDSPVLVMDPSYTLCLNQGFVTVTAPNFDGYQWLDNSGIVLGTNQSYDFNAGGNYALVVNNADGCTDRADFVIEDSENPVITDVIYTEFTENNTIKVFVAGAVTNTIVAIDHFEYALDNGPYQDSNVFEGVTPGVHYVVVRDKNGCGETAAYEVVVLGYMQYFTPNADGVHDIWKVIALQYFPDSKLYIYDRQGKLINTFTETDLGWDGVYNGNPMPATDYWFRLVLRDGREYRRHFALKR